MSLRTSLLAARTSLVLVTALVVASCGDHSMLTAPAAIRGASATNALADVQCDVSWINPAGGTWSTATNWSTGLVPSANQNVCITMDGTYLVTVYGLVTVNTIRVGAPNNTGAIQVNVEAFYYSSAITATNGIVNHAVIAMNGNIGSNTMYSGLFVTNGVLENNGTLYSYPDGVGSQRILGANLINNGKFIVLAPLQLSKPGAVFENRGEFTTNAQVSLSGSQDQTFRQSAGTLTLSDYKTINVDHETFDFVGGTIVGAPVITNGRLTIAAGNEDAGSFIMRGATTFAGNIAAAQTVYIQSAGPFATMTSATGFTNAGRIEFLWTYGGNNQSYSQLVVTDGVLTNTGTLSLPPHFAFNYITADITNLGTMSVGSVVTLNKVGGVFENRGTITVATGSQLNVAASTNQIFRQVDGTVSLTGSGTMTVNGGTFEVAGGTITGRPQLDNSLLRFAAEASGTGTIATRGANAKLEGDVPAGWTVHVNSAGPAFAQLTSAGSFTNRGTIELARGVAGDNSNTTMLTVTNGVLTNEGTLAIVPDPHIASRTINANVVNNGTFSVQQYVILARQNGTFVNNGTIAFATSRQLIMNGMGQAFTTTGPITGGGRLDFTGVTVNASGDIAAAMTLTNTALHIAGNAIGTLNLTGTYTQASTTSLNVQLRDGTAGGYDRLNITGGALLGTTATLNVTPFQGGCIEPSQTFDIATYTARSGEFAVKNGLNLGGGRVLTTTNGALSYRLTSSGPVCVPPDITAPLITPSVTGTLGNDGWYRSNVTVSWSVVDAESEISTSSGCSNSSVTSDIAGVTFTCSATSAGGTSTQSVTIKRDATAPVVQGELVSAANQYGWYNADVSVRFSFADAMSGPSSGTEIQVLTEEGANQSASRTYTDRAGNSATATVTGINIDKTAPVVTVTRSPLAGPDGWNSTDVTATWSATDALAGLAGSATATMLFSDDGANQGGSRSFTDRAGNSASASIADININKTPTPPPALAPTCSATPSVIWPANNKMVAVRVTVGGTGVTSYVLRSVSNNESGSADVTGWEIGSADVEGSVLAKRLGGGSGRTYSLTYDVFGVGGATGSCVVTVRVPHDQGRSR